MRSDSQNRITSAPRAKFVTLAGLLVLLGADFIFTPHAPLHSLPSIGIYMLVTLIGTGAAMGLTCILRKVLRRREDYYDR
jgi:CHASE1-domain containing sensor protein